MTEMTLDIANEFMYAPFGDTRLTERLPKVGVFLAANPEKSIWGSCESPSGAKSVYRFVDNAKVAHDKCQIPHRRETRKRIAGHDEVLIVQDTTHLDYLAHKGAELGLYSTSPSAKGILLHSALAVADGVPLGLLHQRIWTRPPGEHGKRNQRKNLPSEEKESHKWVEGLRQSVKGLPEGTKAIFVCDREADVYDFMREAMLAEQHFLIRAAQKNRRVDGQTCLYQEVSSQPVAGRCLVDVPRKQGQEPRQAWLEIRFASVILLPPKKGDADLPKLKLFAVLASEATPPKGLEPVEWLLLTDLPVFDLDGAMSMLKRYRQRWLIERFHFVLKSGCRIEDLRLETFGRLANAIAIYSVIAWKLAWLLYQSRVTPEASCEPIISRLEWQVAYCVWNKGAKPPSEPPTLAEVVLLIAKIGGFKARKSDGNPGLKTLWWGMDKLRTMVQTAQALCPSQIL